MKNEIQVLVTMELSDEARARIQETSPRIKLTVIPAKKPEDISDSRWKDVEVLYTWNVLPEAQKAPNLQWVQFKSAGIDSYADHPLLRSSEVMVTNTSGVITSQIAEYVLMALLAFGQKLPKLLRYQQKKKWPKESEKWQDFMPIELRHSTVGIIGYGSIGRQVARLLNQFGATILAAKKNVMHPEDSGYMLEGMGDPHGDFFSRLYPIEALHSLLAECDFVVLTLPLTESTRHILDESVLKAMKSTAYVINVGRGGLIDEQALVAALKARQIAGAALDVFEEEPLPEDSPLWGMDNVIISPHVSGISHHLNDETLTFFIENINRFLSELPLYNRVDPNEGY